MSFECSVSFEIALKSKWLSTLSNNGVELRGVLWHALFSKVHSSESVYISHFSVKEDDDSNNEKLPDKSNVWFGEITFLGTFSNALLSLLAKS